MSHIERLAFLAHLTRKRAALRARHRLLEVVIEAATSETQRNLAEQARLTRTIDMHLDSLNRTQETSP